MRREALEWLLEPAAVRSVSPAVGKDKYGSPEQQDGVIDGEASEYDIPDTSDIHALSPYGKQGGRRSIRSGVSWFCGQK